MIRFAQRYHCQEDSAERSLQLRPQALGQLPFSRLAADFDDILQGALSRIQRVFYPTDQARLGASRLVSEIVLDFCFACVLALYD